VKENNGFNGSPTSLITVQGNPLPRYYYETFRIIGFPAIIESHLSLGIGYEFSPTFSVNVGYVHGFEETIKETGTDFTGNPVTIESTLEENSIDFELVWRF
jgi:long-chain fatty acid transport protein